MTEDEFKKKDTTNKSKPKRVALKDFHLFQPPETDIMIKKGDDLNDLGVDKRFNENLITEKVLKG